MGKYVFNAGDLKGTNLSDPAVYQIDYQHKPVERRSSRLVLFGATTAIVADVALLLSIFIRRGGQYWGPYLKPVTIFWSEPIFFASLLLGIIAIFAAGLGVLRPAAVIWKVVVAVGAVAYWAGFGCVVFFGLI